MSQQIHKVLFTSDLSPASKYVFDYAVGLANKYGAKITIIHVIEEISGSIRGMLGGILGEDRIGVLREKYKDEAMSVLVGKATHRIRALITEGIELFCKDATAELPEFDSQTDDVVVTSGSVVDEIVRQAKERGCDLIVMGSRGHGLLAEAVLGSTVRGVLKRSEIPIFVVPIPKNVG